MDHLLAVGIPCRQVALSPLSVDGRPLHRKMHNKFIIIDDHTVLLGSPNASYNAYRANIESIVAITNKTLVQAYIRYFYNLTTLYNQFDDSTPADSYVRAVTAKVDREIQGYTSAHNTTVHPAKICLAPACDIQEFVKASLDNATRIRINMFLVSRNPQSGVSGDIVAKLLPL